MVASRSVDWVSNVNFSGRVSLAVGEDGSSSEGVTTCTFVGPVGRSENGPLSLKGGDLLGSLESVAGCEVVGSSSSVEGVNTRAFVGPVGQSRNDSLYRGI